MARDWRAPLERTIKKQKEKRDAERRARYAEKGEVEVRITGPSPEELGKDALKVIRDIMEEQEAAERDATSTETQVQTSLTDILGAVFGQECWDDSVDQTARRMISAWLEYQPKDELEFEFTTFPAVANQLIVVKDIEFSSLCSHHLLPYYGKAHVGYVSNRKMIGLSKIPRLVDFWAKRPSVQERLTRNIASDLKDRLEAHGVAVVVEARHTCMACRGVRKHNGAMVTSEMRGVFLTSGEARNEFLMLIDRGAI